MGRDNNERSTPCVGEIPLHQLYSWRDVARQARGRNYRFILRMPTPYLWQKYILGSPVLRTEYYYYAEK